MAAGGSGESRVSAGQTWQNGGSKTARGSAAPTADRAPGPDRPHLDERGSAVSIMLPPDSEGNTGTRGWRARDLTPQSVAPLLERFGWYHERRGNDECWIWGGPYNKVSGYGQVSRSSSHPEGQHVLAHRLAWVTATGKSLTDDITIDHLCVNQLCVNPAHLEPVTLSVNSARRNQRPDGERAYPKICADDLAAARARASERIATARAEQAEHNRAEQAARRGRPVSCERCGRVVRRNNLSVHIKRGCRPGGRRKAVS